MPEVQYFNGIKFKPHNMGYLQATVDGKQVLMHRYVWEYYNGTIPSGYVVHHKDEDKTNNDISNLECLPNKEHSSMHGKNMSPERREKNRKQLNIARIKASEWHRSEAGRAWAKENAKRLVEQGKLNPTTLYTCDNCGKQFIGIKRRAKHKFCSGACEQYFRRHNGLNTTTRTCTICGKDFQCDRYEHTQTCSRSCAMKLAHKNAPYNWRTGEGKYSTTEPQEGN